MSVSSECIEFGQFRLLPVERRLLKGEIPVQIGSRALDILIALVEHAGEVVTKQELLSRVWPDVVVEESSLRVHVAALRKVLADGNEQARHIVNVAGRGYTFVASLATAPSAAPVRKWPGSLPKPPARVIGRDTEMGAITELLLTQRFVTIHGTGGIGKTTLGVAVANAQAHAAADGVCFVDLSLNTGVHTVPEALALALGLLVRASDPTSSILDFIRDREMLLVLDSCEAMIDAAALLAESIVQQAPGISILATSREPLRARGEHVYPLAPLTSPPANAVPKASELLVFPAVQLFCERAAEAGYRAELGDADAVVVGDICRRLDGNALALELAASRVSAYGLRQTADLLDSHMKLVWRGRRTAPPRHQTLNAMLDWSYALIGEGERALLRQLSVFVGAFGLDEARGVAGGGEDIVETLGQLVLKSLVAADASAEPPRYRLLDTTRDYARVKLVQSGEAGETSRRHARYYLDWLTRSTGRAHTSPEHLSNVRAALEWAFSGSGDLELGVALATSACELFQRMGMLTESRRWSERGLAALPPQLAGSLQDMRLRAALAQAMMLTGDNMAAVRVALEHTLGMAERLDDPVHQFRLLSSLHMYHRRISAIDDLLPIARRAAEVAARIGGSDAPHIAQAMLGVSHHIKGNLAEAHAALGALHDASVDRKTVVNSFGFHGDAYVLIAVTLWMRGLPDQAAEMAGVPASTDEEKDPVTACLCLMWRIVVFYFRGDWEIAERYIEQMVRVASEHGLAPHKWFGIGVRGTLQVQRGNSGEGIGNLRESLHRLREGGYIIFTPWLTCCLAEAIAARRDVDQAVSLLTELDPTPGDRSDVFMPEFLRVRGSISSLAGDMSGAERLFRQSIEMTDMQGALSWRLRAVSSQARMYLMQGRIAEARAPLAGTYARFTEGFETLDLRNARALMAEIDGRAAPGVAT